MYCTNCGSSIGSGDRFCTHCGTPAGSSAASPATQRRLVRILPQKKIAGVCAGFARYFGLDVTLVRVVWLLVAICTVVPGFLAYLIAWIAMPREYGSAPSSSEMAVTHS
jgi:phage shock protein C